MKTDLIENEDCRQASPEFLGRHVCAFYRNDEDLARLLSDSAEVFDINSRSRSSMTACLFLGMPPLPQVPAHFQSVAISPEQAPARIEAWARQQLKSNRGTASLFVVVDLTPLAFDTPARLPEISEQLSFLVGRNLIILSLFNSEQLPSFTLKKALSLHPWLMANGECFENEGYAPPGEGFTVLYHRLLTKRESLRNLQRSELLYRTLTDISPDGILLTEPTGVIRFASPGMLKMFGHHRLEEAAGLNVFDLVAPEQRDEAWRSFKSAMRHEKIGQHVFLLMPPNGRKFYAEIEGSTILDSGGCPEWMVLVVRDITDIVQLRGTLREHTHRLDLLLHEAPAQIWTVDANMVVTSYLGTANKELNIAPDKIVGTRLDYLFPAPDDEHEHIKISSHRRALNGEEVSYSYTLQDRHYHARVEPIRDEEGAITGVIGVGIDVTDEEQAREAAINSEQSSKALLDAVQSMAVLVDAEGRIVAINEPAARSTQLSPDELIGKRYQEIIVSDGSSPLPLRIQEVVEQRAGQNFTVESPSGEYEVSVKPAFDSQGNVVRLAIAVNDVSHLVRAKEVERERREVAETIHITSEALSRTMQLDEIFAIILRGLKRLITVGVAHILLVEGDNTQAVVLEEEPDSPIRRGLKEQDLHISDSIFLSSVVEDGLPVVVTDLSKDHLAGPLPGGDEVHSYVGVPIHEGREVYGILGISSDDIHAYGGEESTWLENFAAQASANIQKAQVFAALESSNQELVHAYDATISGWARALELRDKDTEGHSKRVVDLTQRLAMMLGAPESDLNALRWGALLHDIGKMAIPDHILLKPGPLTEEEWMNMKQHPRLAYEMLAGINYLRPALAIPYSHHEQWNGRGYPQGLKGEEIPLPARIFAVVDAYDALTSHRPYRPAWPETEVLRHIREQSGKQFDPAVVEAFLKIV